MEILNVLISKLISITATLCISSKIVDSKIARDRIADSQNRFSYGLSTQKPLPTPMYVKILVGKWHYYATFNWKNTNQL